MVVSSATKLKQIREEFRNPKVSQEHMARRANVSLQTYNKAENGISVRYATAISILAAINEVRQERGLDPVQLADLGLQLY